MQEEVEVWEDVVGFEDHFRVSSIGRVFSKRSCKELKQYKRKNGYKTVSTRIGGRKGTIHCFKVHRLVAEAFLPPPTKELVMKCANEGHGKVLVCHKDSVRDNNVVSNLKWGSSQDNTDDFLSSPAFNIWLVNNTGANKSSSKLSWKQVKYIRSVYVARCKVNGCRALAALYGISHSEISRIINNLSYKVFS